MTSATMLALLNDHISPHPDRTEADRLLLGLLYELVEEIEHLQAVSGRVTALVAGMDETA